MPSVVKLRHDWQFNVYFQLAFRSFASKFEQILKEEPYKWNVILDCAMQILADIWGTVFLPPLLAKFLRFSLQLEGRFRVAVIPKILEQSSLPESKELGQKIISEMEIMHNFVQSKLKLLVSEPSLYNRLSSITHLVILSQM